MLSVQELITEDAPGQGDVWRGAAHGALLQAVRRRTSRFGSQLCGEGQRKAGEQTLKSCDTDWYPTPGYDAG